MFDGQSLGYTPWVPEQSYPKKFMALAHPDLRHFVTNIAGTTYAQRGTSLPGRTDYLFPRSVHTTLIDDGGTYDLEEGQGNLTAAQLLSTKTAYTAARRAAGADYVVGLTVAPSVILTATEETNRQTVNAALVASPNTYGYDEIINLDAIPNLADPNNAAYYYDGTHWTDAATTLVAQALVTAGV